MEERYAEEKRTLDFAKKERDNLNKKHGQLQQALAVAEKNIELFQLEKQAKLNELQTVVPLYLHQIEYFGERFPVETLSYVNQTRTVYRKT